MEIDDNEITESVKDANERALELAKSPTHIEDYVTLLSNTIENLHTVTALCVAVDGPRDPNEMARMMQKIINAMLGVETVEQAIVLLAQGLVSNLSLLRDAYVQARLEGKI